MNNSLKRLSTVAVALAVTVVATLLLAACGGSDPGVRIQPITRGTPDPAGTADPNATAGSTADTQPVELPFAPSNRVSGGLVVAEYLAGGLADIEDCLPELVRDWDLEPVAGMRCAEVDIDADGRDELLYTVSVAGEPAPPGDVWFFDDKEADYRLFTSARALSNQILAGVNIEAVLDLTGDGKPEAVISAQSCDGDRCVTEFVIASAHRGFAVEDLAPSDLTVTSTEGLTFEDGTNDQLADLQIRREADSADRAAGPQRGATLIVSWSGLRFRVDEEPDDPEFLIHLVADADEAYNSSDLGRASDLYLQIASDRGLRDWKAEQGLRAGRLELQPYALFRAALVAQRQGSPANALQLLDRAFTEHPNSIHGQAAGVYLQSIRDGNAASTACAATEAYIGRLAAVYDDIWDYGFANPDHPVTALCR